jgi:dTDP-4-amino-4,6-dideoxy-D-galactose acyltransferase
MEQFKILEWDSDFFGYKVASILPGKLNREQLANCLAEMKKAGVTLAYWQSDLNNEELEIATAQGGKNVDLKTIYGISLQDIKLNDFPEYAFIQPYTRTDVDGKLIDLAIQSGIYSRFNSDDKIGYDKFVSLYTKWITQSVTHQIAKEVLVSMEGDKITGMITLGEKNNSGNIGLIAVDESQRGKGVGKALINESLRYFIKQGYNSATVVTQGFNRPACVLYEKNGFEVLSQNPFFHFWF